MGSLAAVIGLIYIGAMLQQGRYQFRRIDQAGQMQWRHRQIAAGLDQHTLAEQRQPARLMNRGEHLRIALSACPFQEDGRVSRLPGDHAYRRFRHSVLRVVSSLRMPARGRLWQATTRASGRRATDVDHPALSYGDRAYRFRHVRKRIRTRGGRLGWGGDGNDGK